MAGQRISPISNRPISEPPTGPRLASDTARIYSQVVERYARLIDRPEARLRFLNNTLAKQAKRQEELQQSLQKLKFLEKTRFYDWVLEARLYSSILEEMRALMKTMPQQHQQQLEQLQVPLKARFLFACYQARHVLYVVGMVLMGFVLFGLYSFVMWSGQRVSAYIASQYGKSGPTIIVNTQTQPSATPAVTTLLKSYDNPEKVWLLGEENGVERWSNNGRIQRKYEIGNHSRGYYLLRRGSETLGSEVRQEPIGIVYHTSEGHMLTFAAENSDSIQKRSQGLVEYVRQNKSYNYVIDRFGEIYRVVRDDQAAHHAGKSVWADQDYVYVGLNESFIGVCFESTMAAGSLIEQLTEAQVISGRQLTNILRGKYKISDANCTTHGLVSVNPDTMVIAFHHDWAKNFPFEAMGLSDKYQVKPVSITDYGFTWDQDILTKLNNTLWAGAIEAETEFKRRAERQNVSPDALRRRLRDVYVQQYDRLKALHATTTAKNTGKNSLSNDAGESTSN